MAKRVLTVLFFIAVIVLLVIYAQKVDWQDVWKVIRGYDRLALFSAIALVIVSYLIYGCYDLLGLAYCGHKLAKRQVMLVSFICYAFNLSLSTWLPLSWADLIAVLCNKLCSLEKAEESERISKVTYPMLADPAHVLAGRVR